MVQVSDSDAFWPTYIMEEVLTDMKGSRGLGIPWDPLELALSFLRG